MAAAAGGNGCISREGYLNPFQTNEIPVRWTEKGSGSSRSNRREAARMASLRKAEQLVGSSYSRLENCASRLETNRHESRRMEHTMLYYGHAQTFSEQNQSVPCRPGKTPCHVSDDRLHLRRH